MRQISHTDVCGGKALFVFLPSYWHIPPPRNLYDYRVITKRKWTNAACQLITHSYFLHTHIRIIIFKPGPSAFLRPGLRNPSCWYAFYWNTKKGSSETWPMGDVTLHCACPTKLYRNSSYRSAQSLARAASVKLLPHLCFFSLSWHGLVALVLTSLRRPVVPTACCSSST